MHATVAALFLFFHHVYNFFNPHTHSCDMDQSAWSPGLHAVLESIRKNSITYSNAHKLRYMKYKRYAKRFKIPIILLSSINSVASVGLQSYMQQESISMLTCLVSLMCAVITSIEMYLGIQRTMEIELVTAKEFYLLSIDIYKMLQLLPEERLVNPRAYLDDRYKAYCKLVESCELPHKRLADALIPVRVDHNMFSNDTQPNPPLTPTSSTVSHFSV